MLASKKHENGLQAWLNTKRLKRSLLKQCRDAAKWLFLIFPEDGSGFAPDEHLYAVDESRPCAIARRALKAELSANPALLTSASFFHSDSGLHHLCWPVYYGDKIVAYLLADGTYESGNEAAKEVALRHFLARGREEALTEAEINAWLIRSHMPILSQRSSTTQQMQQIAKVLQRHILPEAIANEISNLLPSYPDIYDLGRAAADVIYVHVPLAYSHVLTVNETKQEIHSVVEKEGAFPAQEQRGPDNDGLRINMNVGINGRKGVCSRVAKTRIAEIAPNTDKDYIFHQNWYGTKYQIAVPIVITPKNHSATCLAVFSAEGEGFDATHLALLKQVFSHPRILAAFQNTWNGDWTRTEAVDNLSRFQQIVTELTDLFRAEGRWDLLNQIAQSILMRFPAFNIIDFVISDAKRKCLHVPFTFYRHGVRPAASVRPVTRLPLDASLSGEAWRAREIKHFTGEDLKRFYARDFFVANHICDMVSIPLHLKEEEEPSGIINLYRSRDSALYTMYEQDKEALRLMGQFVAIALTRQFERERLVAYQKASRICQVAPMSSGTHDAMAVLAMTSVGGSAGYVFLPKGDTLECRSRVSNVKSSEIQAWLQINIIRIAERVKESNKAIRINNWWKDGRYANLSFEEGTLPKGAEHVSALAVPVPCSGKSTGVLCVTGYNTTFLPNDEELLEAIAQELGTGISGAQERHSTYHFLEHELKAFDIRRICEKTLLLPPSTERSGARSLSV